MEPAGIPVVGTDALADQEAPPSSTGPLSPIASHWHTLLVLTVQCLYQGWARAVQIGLLGAMGGVLARWCKSVRPGMFAHALQDILGGVIRH